MTEHLLPVDGQSQGVVTLHKGDTIRTVQDVELALDSFGFGRLNVAWRRPAHPHRCEHCPTCAAGAPPLLEDADHDGCTSVTRCPCCGHHASHTCG